MAWPTNYCDIRRLEWGEVNQEVELLCGQKNIDCEVLNVKQCCILCVLWILH